MPRRRINKPDSAGLVINYVPDSPAAGDLELPLLHFTAVMTVKRKVATELVLPVMIGP
jgi:hypothetical protein